MAATIFPTGSPERSAGCCKRSVSRASSCCQNAGLWNARSPGSRDIDDKWLPVADFLEKPVDFDVLVGKVKELLEKASSENAGGGEGD